MVQRVGQQLGNYRLLRLLGRGGFAEVYLGEQIYLHTRAALKVLHIQLAQDRIQDFLNEAQIIAHLKHPRIVQILDFAVQEGTPFLVMEYAPHGSLRRQHPAGTILPLQTVVSYVKDIAGALQFAHEHKLIHRDVKPENMLLDETNAVLLSDFGLAIVAQSSLHQRPRDIMGTVTYMAPEQLQGRPCIASDQYALGIVVYEWLCGTPPFTGLHSEIIAQQMMSSPPSLCERNPGIPPAVEQVILKALHKSPHQRFASVADFAAALERVVLLEESESADQPSAVSVSLPGRYQQRPFIGRHQEREWLHQHLLRAEQHYHASSSEAAPIHSWTTPSRVPFILLSGEAGIGKTRLAEEVSREAQQRGWSIIWSRLYAQERNVPYRPWTEVLRKALRQGLWQPQQGKQHALYYQPLTALLPELVDLLPPETGSTGAASEQEQLRLWEAILSLLIAMSEQKPLLLVLDDLHSADSGSYELLAYLVRRLADHPVLLLGTYRDQELLETHAFLSLIANLHREHVIATLSIKALTDAQIGELVSYVPAPLIRHIQRKAAGNPFFAEELASLSLDDATQDTGNSSAASRVLPETITAVLNQRLAKLSDACQQFLCHAAVVGSSFTYSTIRLLEECAGSAALNEETLLEVIDEALQARILTEESSGTMIVYHFWHPLLIDHLYCSLSAARRTLLHRNAAQALLREYARREEEGAAMITYHLVQGGASAQQIAHYAEIAGNYAYALAVYAEAERYYRLAVEHGWEQNTCSVETVQLSEGVVEAQLHHAYLLECLGECTRFQGKTSDARHFFECALEIHNSLLGAVPQQKWQGEAQIRAMLWCEIGVTWYDEGDYTRALHCYRYGEQILVEGGITAGHVRANVLYEQGYVLWRSGCYEESYARALQAFSLFQDALQRQAEPLPDNRQSTRLRRTITGDPANLGRVYTLLSILKNTAGQLTEAIEYANKALTIYQVHHYQREIGIGCCTLCDIHLRRGELEAAHAAIVKALAVADRIGDIPNLCVSYSNLGELAMRKGDMEEAETWYQRALVLAEQTNNPVLMSILSSYLALVAHVLGKHEQVRGQIRRAMALNRQVHVPSCSGLTAIICVNIQLGRLQELCETDLVRNAHPYPTRIMWRKLERVRTKIQRILSLEGIDVETRIEGALILAQVNVLLGNPLPAQPQVWQAQQEAEEYELRWLVAYAHRLSGQIEATLGQVELAAKYFEQSSQEFQAYGMRLEYARTLYRHGTTLLQNATAGESRYLQGLALLRMARKLVIECHAGFDLQRVERILVALSDTPTPEHAV